MVQLSVHSQTGQERGSFGHISGHFTFANQAASPAETTSPDWSLKHWRGFVFSLIWLGSWTQHLWARSYLFFLFISVSLFPLVLRTKQSLPNPQIHSLPSTLLCALGGWVWKTASRWHVGFGQSKAPVGKQRPERKKDQGYFCLPPPCLSLILGSWLHPSLPTISTKKPSSWPISHGVLMTHPPHLVLSPWNGSSFLRTSCSFNILSSLSEAVFSLESLYLSHLR